jgi:hypothetical protein
MSIFIKRKISRLSKGRQNGIKKSLGWISKCGSGTSIEEKENNKNNIQPLYEFTFLYLFAFSINYTDFHSTCELVFFPPFFYLYSFTLPYQFKINEWMEQGIYIMRFIWKKSKIKQKEGDTQWQACSAIRSSSKFNEQF